MKKWYVFKSISLLLLVLLLVAGFSGNGFAQANTDHPSTLSSAKHYIQYLEGYDADEALRLGIEESEIDSAVQNAKETLAQFKELSHKDQNKFLNYMRNPQKLLQETYSNKNPDLQLIEDEETVMPGTIQLMASSRTVSHTGTLTAMGISWTQYKIEGRYEYTSTGATKHLATDAYVVKNFNPAVTNSRTSKSGYVSGGMYYGSAAFAYKIGVIGTGWGAQIGTIHISVKGNHNGKYSGSFWRE